MKLLTSAKILILTAVFMVFFVTGCKENSTDVNSSEPQTDQQAFEKLADEDSSLTSFDDNYNEDGPMGWLGKTETAIVPFKVGAKMELVSRTITYNTVGDTSFAVLVKTYNGTLFIAGSYDTLAGTPDTVIKKNFTSTVTRNLIFVRTGNSNRPYQNWRLAAISLPSGGTTIHNSINIQEITMYLPNDTLTISNPLDYYLARGKGWWRQLPIVPKNSNITVTVEVFSTSQDTDFVTLTWGGDHMGMNRAKKRFTLVSSTPTTGGYVKLYEQTYSSKGNHGFFHAVINALPKAVVFDDQVPVETSTWGFPYFVRMF